MSNPHAPHDTKPGSESYEIRLAGHLHNRWAAWFEGLAFSHQTDGTTVISGHVADQAALHGLLQRVRDLGLSLISVTRVGSDLPVPSDLPAIDRNRSSSDERK